MTLIYKTIHTMILRSFSSFLSFLIHSHSHPLTPSHVFLNFITWITVCTNEQIYWYCLTSFFKKGYMLYSFVLCLLHLKINLENYSMPVIEIFIFAAAMEHLTHLRVCTYKLMRMTNCILWLWWQLIFKSKYNAPWLAAWVFLSFVSWWIRKHTCL